MIPEGLLYGGKLQMKRNANKQSTDKNQMLV